MKTLIKKIAIAIVAIVFANGNCFSQPTSLGNGIYLHPLTWPTGTSTINKRISGLCIDSTKNIWIGTQKFGVVKYFNGVWSSFYNLAGGNLPNDEVTCLSSNGNNIYVGTKGGIAFFNGSTWTKYTTFNSNLADSIINCLVYRNNILYAGTNKGLCKFDGINWTTYSMLNSQIVNDTILSVELSANGDVWAGTVKGLAKFSGTTWTKYDSLNSSLKENIISSLCVDNSGSLWVGTSKSGIYKNTINGLDSLGKLFPAYYSFPAKGTYLSKSNNGGILTYHNVFKTICEVSDDYQTYNLFPINFTSTFKYFVAAVDSTIWFISDFLPTSGTGIYSLEKNKAIANDQYNCVSANNLKASISSSGTLFWDKNTNPLSEMPKASGKTSIFSAGLWIGAKDNQGNLHVAAERYRANGADFFFGPVMDTNYYQAESSKWNHVWKVNKSEIDFHNSHWWTGGYQMPESIKNWPGNGDISKGQSKNIAPYLDLNANGTYDPLNGDYPIIRGDQAIFFVFNDVFEHKESMGIPLKFEIHGMAYEFDKPNDSVLNNTLFLSYRIFNKSQNNYDSLFLGLVTDIDLGYAYDDYVGCDTALSMYYGYNGMAIDGFGASGHYGVNPPAIGTVFLNNTMSTFMYFTNSNGNPNTTDPDSAKPIYNYMKAIWSDGSHLRIGGNGHASGGGTGPEYNFMFPGNIIGWPFAWTEETANNTPGDRRGLGSVGPYNLPVNGSFCFDVAYVFARDYNNSLGAKSVNLLKQRAGDLRTYYNTNLSQNCNDFNTKIDEPINKNEFSINVFPNPTTNNLNIEQASNEEIQIEIVDFTGKVILAKSTSSTSTTLNFSKFNTGVYLVRISSDKGMVVKKVVKM